MATESAINVMVSGAVQSVGCFSLRQPATLRGALDAAHGLAKPSPQRKPADIVTVRRRLGERKIDEFRFSLSETPSQWEEFPLADGDLVVFQWDIEMKET